MKEAMLNMLPLLVGAAISPIATVGMIAVLTTKTNPRVKGLLYLLGASLPLLVIGIVSIFFLNGLSLTPQNSSISSTIDLVAGVLLLSLAIKNFIVKKPQKTTKHSSQLGPYKAIALGIGLMFTNFSTIVLFIPAIKEIAISSFVNVEKLVMLMLAILITLTMIACPLVIAILLPNSSKKLLQKLREFILRHNKTIVQAMLIVFGIYLLARGLGITAS